MLPKNTLAVVLSFFAFFIISFILIKNRNSVCTDATYNTPLYIKENLICVEVVNTPEKMQKGLGDRNNLGENQGMLFIFPNKGTLTFWMKDMHFDIDMIWIDNDKIVDVSKNATYPSANTSDSELPVYSPNQPANKVLEVNAGYFDKNNLAVGDLVH